MSGIIEDSESVYKSISSRMKSILGDESSSLDNEDISRTSNMIEACSLSIEREYLMSKNETIEDISTNSLKV